MKRSEVDRETDRERAGEKKKIQIQAGVKMQKY